MADNLTTQVCGFAQISAAAMDGDFTHFIGASGELDSLKTQINQMVFNLRDSIQKNTAAREAAKLANHGKSEALANMSHRIRDKVSLMENTVHHSSSEPRRMLVNGIIRMTELALDSNLNRSQRESLLLIHSLTRSLLLIIDDILDISKSMCHRDLPAVNSLAHTPLVEAGQMTMERVSFLLRQTVFGILKTLVVHACNSNLDLTYDVDPDIPDQLISDSFHL